VPYRWHCGSFTNETIVLAGRKRLPPRLSLTWTVPTNPGNEADAEDYWIPMARCTQRRLG
jgi:hypothetical protein